MRKANQHYKRGWKLVKKKRNKSALAEFEKAYKLYQDYRILAGIGKAATGLKRYPLAISAYERYLNDGSDRVSSSKRIIAEVEIDRLNEEAAVEEKKQEALEHFKAGSALRTRGSFAKAIAEFNTAYEIHPTHKLLYDIAKTQAMMEENEAAIETYGRYLEDGSEEISKSQRKRVEKEIARLRAAVEEAEKKAQSKERFKAGRSLKAKNKCKEAVVEFDEAYKLDANFEILLPMAECNTKTKDYQKALENYNLYLFKGGGNITKKQRKKVNRAKDRLVTLIKKSK